MFGSSGIGRFGQVVNRFLISNNIKTVVLDYQVSQVDTIRRINTKAYYGDATRPDLLKTAGIEQASLFVVAIDNRESSVELSLSSLQLLGHSEEYVLRRKATYKRVEKEASKRLYDFWLKESAGERFSNDFIKLFMLYEERLKQAMDEDNAAHQQDIDNQNDANAKQTNDSNSDIQS